MRILWFSVTPSLFNPRSNSHNGGGWIASLEKIIRTDKSISLGVAFEFPDTKFKYDIGGVCYYPIDCHTSFIKRLNRQKILDKKIKACLNAIQDFNPDLIQIFGSENDFGLLRQYTDIPIVIHIQGCLPPYLNALFPIGMNQYDFYFQRGLNWHRRLIGIRSESSFRHRAEQEIQTIQHCHYFMGRTEWDKRLINLFNPKALYFHCDEALRDSFLKEEKKWQFHVSDKINLISVISNPWYKGTDLILKTAQLLKRFTSINFIWQVYGVQDIHFYERKYKIYATEVNVHIMGTASKEELADALYHSTYYVHPSYIDNSPNSICEAQILGLPVLSTNVGGISSLIKDGETGLLFPANDPYTLAALIQKLNLQPDLAIQLGQAAREQALNRHNPEKIKDTISCIYKKILKNEKNSSTFN
mgnify:FL=1